MSNRALINEKPPSSPSKTEIGPALLEDNLRSSWTPAAIANSIVGTFAQSYASLTDSTQQNDGSQMIPDKNGKEGDEVEECLPDCGTPEYTSEHLEKALFDLRSTAILSETEGTKEEQIQDVKVETKVKETAFPEFRESQMSTDISYSANLKQHDEINEIKPLVENISTQSNIRRAKLNTQTTTENVNKIGHCVNTSSTSLKIPCIPRLISTSNVEVLSTVSERQIRKSKVPILKPDHTNRALSSTSIRSVSSQVRLKNYNGSKIPQRTATSLSPSRDSISNSKSILNLNMKWPPLQRMKNARINEKRETIQNAISDPSVKVANCKNVSPPKCPTKQKSRHITERPSCTRVKLPNITKAKNKAEEIIPPMRYKLGREVQLQTDQIPPCGSQYNVSLKKEPETEQYKEKRRVEIEQICQNLIENILNVEQALDNLPRADVVTLSALCAAYNCVLGKHAEPMSSESQPEFQETAQREEQLKSQTGSAQEEPSSFVEPEREKKMEVKLSEELSSGSSKDESKLSTTELNSGVDGSNQPSQAASSSETGQSRPVSSSEKVLTEKTIVPGEGSSATPKERQETIPEIETDDDYEDYDESLEIKDCINDLTKMENFPNKSFTGGMGLARESRTCVLGAPPNVGIKSPFSSDLEPKAVPKHTDIIRASAEKSIICEPPVALPTTVSMSDVIKSVSSRTFMVITKPKPEQKAKVGELPGQQKPCTNAIKVKSAANLNGFQRSREDLAIEANLFNMIQSQKINNILRFAMPHNETLLPVFVSSPSSIMHTLKMEMLHTLETKKMYYCAIAHTPETGQGGILSGITTPLSVEQSKQILREKLERSKSMWLIYGAVMRSPNSTSQPASWTKPMYYYGNAWPVACAQR